MMTTISLLWWVGSLVSPAANGFLHSQCTPQRPTPFFPPTIRQRHSPLLGTGNEKGTAKETKDHLFGVMLDEGVQMHYACQREEFSTLEAERLIQEVTTFLEKTTSPDTPEARDSSSSSTKALYDQVSEATLGALHDQNLLPRVDELAQRLRKATDAAFENEIVSNFTKLRREISDYREEPTYLTSKHQHHRNQAKLDQRNQESNQNQISCTSETASSLFASQRGSSTRTRLYASAPSDHGQGAETRQSFNHDKEETDEVDVAIVGAGIGGLCAGAILNTVYGKKVGIYESHYLAGGCAHAFKRKAATLPNHTFTFDSGPTIVLGCSSPPYNPLRQVLDAVGQEVEWIPYSGWGMIEYPGAGGQQEIRWKVELGEDIFQAGPLATFGSEKAQHEFEALRKATHPLVTGAVDIPAMAMRPGSSALIPLLRYLPALLGLLRQGAELTQGTFAPFMDGPLFTVSDQWLRSWLDALAFSLSGLPAPRTSAAAMAYVLFDMHRAGSSLDYPKGGLGSVIDALVRGVEQGRNGSKVNLRCHVESIDTTQDGSRIEGLTLNSGKKVSARDGVICNAPVWSLRNLIKNPNAVSALDGLLPSPDSHADKDWIHPQPDPLQSWIMDSERRAHIRTVKVNGSREQKSVLNKCDSAEMTGSFLHLHVAIRSDGLDLAGMEAHYTVMDRGLSGSIANRNDGPCGELNMIAVSNPCVIDKSLSPEGYIVLHAYGAGNEPYERWKDLDRTSEEYQQLKEERSAVLWRALEAVIPDIRKRVVLDLVGSPLTHEFFLRRPMGTYGSATEDYLRDGSTPCKGLVLAGDGIFPGIGIPAVALSGASAANALVSPVEHWKALDELKREGVIT